MAAPRVPDDDRGTTLGLPCGEELDVRHLDMGLREYACDCGEAHAVVMDVHPLGRFVPEAVESTLTASVEPRDAPQFGTTHLLAMVREEYPERVASLDVAEEGAVGYARVWVTEFDARTLHEIVVELVVELMEHAVSHAEDPKARADFEERMAEFDVATFVDRYREERDFEDEYDSAV